MTEKSEYAELLSLLNMVNAITRRSAFIPVDAISQFFCAGQASASMTIVSMNLWKTEKPLCAQSVVREHLTRRHGYDP